MGAVYTLSYGNLFSNQSVSLISEYDIIHGTSFVPALFPVSQSWRLGPRACFCLLCWPHTHAKALTRPGIDERAGRIFGQPDKVTCRSLNGLYCRPKELILSYLAHHSPLRGRSRSNQIGSPSGPHYDRLQLRSGSFEQGNPGPISACGKRKTERKKERKNERKKEWELDCA
jgi:hypothetical protein